MSLTDERVDTLIPSAYVDGVYLGYGKGDLRKFARAIESAATAPLLEKIAELEQQLETIKKNSN
jgi:hypothetical protein